jgi:hypothetical protein
MFGVEQGQKVAAPRFRPSAFHGAALPHRDTVLAYVIPILQMGNLGVTELHQLKVVWLVQW